MGSIFAIGTGCAARMRGSAASRMMLATIALPLIGAASPGRIDVEVAGLRSAKGNIIMCLTRDPAHFPECDGDPAGRRIVVAAKDAAAHFPSLPSGDYALALIHDENGNGKLDTRFGLPREGVGFSRNPRITFGPPRFAAAAFPVGARPVEETVKLKYFL